MINICKDKLKGLVISGIKIQMTYIYRTKDIFKAGKKDNDIK